MQQLSDQMRQQSGGKPQKGQRQQQNQQRNSQNQNQGQSSESQSGPHSDAPMGEEGVIGIPTPMLGADADWFKTGGGVSGEALRDDGADLPEYRDLNRSYFEALGELERR